jgi:CubicO group peptidase (beta-lactamase class C family)
MTCVVKKKREVKYNFIILLNVLLLFGCESDPVNHVLPITKIKKNDTTLVVAVPKTPLQIKMDSLFSGLNGMGAFNGSILVSKNGTILYQQHFGYCNRADGCKLNDSSLFQLASVSKVITSTAVLLLQERGKIDLEKKVNDYLPDFPYEGITIKNLLSHRSGLPNYVYALHSELYKPDYKMDNADMYCLIKERNPARYLKPNRRFNYSNTNYAILALVVEKVSGKQFAKFLKDEIFDPIGMKHTTTINQIDLNGYNVTKPYDEKWKAVEFDASDYVLGDKSIYSTVHDLYLFSEAMYHNKILKAETQTLAYKPYSREKVSSNYGLGWRLRDYKDSLKKEVFHNGWWHGYRSSFHRRLHDSLTVIILSNQLNKAAYQTHLIYQLLDSSIDTTGLEGGDE